MVFVQVLGITKVCVKAIPFGVACALNANGVSMLPTTTEPVNVAGSPPIYPNNNKRIDSRGEVRGQVNLIIQYRVTFCFLVIHNKPI